MFRSFAGIGLFSLLAACATDPGVSVATAEQDCRLVESRLGTNRLSTRCAKVSDEERAKARAEAEAIREDMNRMDLPKPGAGSR